MATLSSFSFPKNKKIVIFSPLPDDDVIGLGGTIQKLRENFNKIKELWFYEITSTLKAPNKIITFDEEIMSKKIKAICAHKSQIERKRYDLATKGLNIFRGINSNAINKNEFGTFGDIQYGEGFYIKIIN